MGLLIGKGGKNIQELERLSDCRLRTFASKECEGMTELHISSSSLKTEEQEKASAACLRAARLVCEEGKTIAQGWQIAREERQQQQERAAKLLEACRLQMAARKLRLVCPEMSMAEASAALRESLFDEDLAFDLFYQGAITIDKVDNEARQPSDGEDSAQKEDFPTLSQCSSNDASVRVPQATRWCPKQVTRTIAVHASARRVLDAEDAEAFPSLPIAKVPTAVGKKSIARVAANRRCPSFRTNACAVTDVPRWQKRHHRS